MNRTSRSSLVLFAAGLALVGYIVWQQGWLRSNNEIPLIPHSAVYHMSLAKLQQGDRIADMQGRTLYALEDSCNGWTVRQKMITRFDSPDAPSAFITSYYNTWESKDGQRFSFAMRRLRDQAMVDNLRGKVELNGAKPPQLTLTQPSEAVVPLVGPLQFPSQQNEAILKAAQAGQTQLQLPLFDGSELDAGNDVTIHIQPASAEFWPHEFAQKPLDAKVKASLATSADKDAAEAESKTPTGQPDVAGDLQKILKDSEAVEPGAAAPEIAKPDALTKANTDAELDKLETKSVNVPGNVDTNLLQAGKVWRVSMAIFPKALPAELKAVQHAEQAEAESDNESAGEQDEQVQIEQPLYEMRMTLHDNGIVSDYTIDYPEFSVHGELVGLSANPSMCR